MTHWLIEKPIDLLLYWWIRNSVCVALSSDGLRTLLLNLPLMDWPQDQRPWMACRWIERHTHRGPYRLIKWCWLWAGWRDERERVMDDLTECVSTRHPLHHVGRRRLLPSHFIHFSIDLNEYEISDVVRISSSFFSFSFFEGGGRIEMLQLLFVSWM